MKLFLLFFLITIAFKLSAQNDSAGMVLYTPEYKFKDGIYISYEQVKLNKPVEVSRLITDSDPESLEFFNDLIAGTTIKFYDDFGVIQSVNTKNIWGYSRNGTLFVNYNYSFNRIPVFGRICHFIADITVTYDRISDPYYYNNYYSPMNMTYETKELRQYVLDFETGNIYNCDLTSVEPMLMSDNEIYNEFNQLKKRKKKKMLFFYIRMYNEKNPIYLPE
ncbi:MAG: hypothetical protein ABIJ16_01770 [Bacteroidota bacterium]